MIKSITAPTLHELLRAMHSFGLDLADTDGTVHTNESGHYYALYEVDESSSGVLDTTAGQCGVSGAIGAGTSYTVGAIRSTVTQANQEATSSGAAVLNFAAGVYIIPRSIQITFSGNAPDLTDDGLGNLVSSAGRTFGTFDYATGIPEWDMPDTVPFSEGSNKYISYQYSTHPSTAAVPNLCKLSRIVIYSKHVGSVINPGDLLIYEESGKVIPSHKVSTSLIATSGSDEIYEASLNGIPSVQRDLIVASRLHRWIETTGSLKDHSVVLLYWEKV